MSTKFVPVRLENVVKNYGTFTALKGVSIDIRAGEFVSILGPSGSGKTTMLQLIGGFSRPTRGQIWFGDTDVTLLPPQKRDIGVVFQNYALFPHLSVAENIAFPLRARKVPGSQIAAQVERALATVELGGYGDRPIAKLSGGQRQRVALARAIVFEPRLILMDEPLSALDKNLRETMQLELRSLHAKLGATIVYVTHDQREALTMSDRVAVMNAGRIVQVDTPRTLYSAPADAFVAGFVGESTLLPVTRTGTNTVRLGDAVLRSSRPLPTDQGLHIALQAEALLPCAADEAHDDSNYLSGQALDVVFQGESLKVKVVLADGTEISFRAPSHHYNNIALPCAGQSVRLKLHVEDTVIVPTPNAA